MNFRKLGYVSSYIHIEEPGLRGGLVATIHDRSDVNPTKATMAAKVSPDEAWKYQRLFAKSPEMYDELELVLSQIGNAEWGSDKHGAEMYEEFIKKHYPIIKKLIQEIEG